MNIRNTAAISASLAMVAAGAVASVEGDVVEISEDVNVSPELSKSIDTALSTATVQGRVEATIDAIHLGMDAEPLAGMATVRTEDGIKVAGTAWLPSEGAAAVMTCHACYGDCDTTCHTDCHTDCNVGLCHSDCHYDCYTPNCHVDCYTPSCHTDCHSDFVCFSYADILTYPDASVLTPCLITYGDIVTYADILTYPDATLCHTDCYAFTYGDCNVCNFAPPEYMPE